MRIVDSFSAQAGIEGAEKSRILLSDALMLPSFSVDGPRRFLGGGNTLLYQQVSFMNITVGGSPLALMVTCATM